jgi:hypothetical protein
VNGLVDVGIDMQAVDVQRASHVAQCGIDHIGRRNPLAFRGDRASINPRHVENVIEQAGKAIEFSKCDLGLLPPFRIRLCVSEIADGDADRCQRRAEVVAQRREQCGRERAPRRLARPSLSRR